jgi:ubiquinone/menaquinone biosynthesis C-methylase UbiE
MGHEKTPGDFGEFSDENRKIWNANAEWWDDQIGDGNPFQIELIEPATECLLDLKTGEVVLDIACGAGRFARRMAELGAHVVAFDYSTRFIQRAKGRSRDHNPGIEYLVLDASDENTLLSLGTNRFDAAVCTMALMDMATIDPLITTLPRLLKAGGRFVFSVAHPCFHSPGVRRFAETYEQKDGRHIMRKGVTVCSYLTPFAGKTEGIIGQPEPQYFFHRSMEMLFNAGFHAGFVIDGFEEPALKMRPDRENGLRWIDMPDIPPVLVVRMRLEHGNEPRAPAGGRR